jgi:hypothetical protein
MYTLVAVPQLGSINLGINFHCFQVSLAIAVSINTYIVSLGFGSHIWTISNENLRTIRLNTILVATFGIIATTTSKTSFALTLYRITSNQWMKYFLIFVMVSITISMNLVWIFGFAKCTPLERVFDPAVPGTCWDGNKLLKFQLFAACKIRADKPSLPIELTVSRRLLGHSGFRAGIPALADHHGHVDATPRTGRSRHRNEFGRYVRTVTLHPRNKIN